MKRTAISIATFLLAVAGQAATIKGRLFNPTFDEGEPFATVRIFKAGSDKPVTTLLADVDGYFTFETKRGGEYRFEFSALAKQPVSRVVKVGNDEKLEMGDIEMKEDAQDLQELVVVAQRPLVQMSADEMTYNVTADADAPSTTLLDLLRKVPMVSVDGQDNITVNGQSNFQVYVDGKPSLLFSGNSSQIFKSMPATAVQKIEVVTNPGARYDAEGAGGVLNLVMNKEGGASNADTRAYNVSAGLNGGSRGFGGSIYATGQVGRLSASLNLMHNRMNPGNSSMVTTRTETAGPVTETYVESKPRLPFTMGSLSLEYEIDSLTSVGASIALNSFTHSARGNVNTTLKQNGETLLAYLNDSYTDGKRCGLNGSLSFNRSFGRGRRNRLQLTYQVANEKQNDLTDNTFDVLIPADAAMDARNSDSRTSTTEQIVLADLTLRLSSVSTLSIGLKGTFRSADADNTYLLNGVPDADGSLNYNNTSRIGAAYGEYVYRNDVLTAKGGLRYEHTWQSIAYKPQGQNDYNTNYGNIVPSASLSYNLAATSNLGLNYNMRISRPGITYLNPYVNRADPTVLSYGNPDLDVEKTHNVSLVYNYFTAKLVLNATLSNAYTGNGIEQYSFMSDGVMNTTYGNIMRRNTTSLNVFANWLVGSGTRLTLNGGLSYLDIRSTQLDASNRGLQGNLMVGVQQTLPLDIRGNVFVVASTKSRTLQGWTTGFKMLSLNLSRAFLDDRLNVSLGFMTGLNRGGKMEMGTYIATPGFTNHSKISLAMTSVNLGVTFRFGSSRHAKEVRTNFIDNDFIDSRSQMESLQNTTETR